jgi:hypothetical protein
LITSIRFCYITKKVAYHDFQGLTWWWVKGRPA